MSSSTSDMESQTSPGGSLLSAVSRKWKLVLSLVLLLGAVAAIGVCAAVVVVSTGSGSSGQGKQDSSRSVEGLEIEDGEMDLVEVNLIVKLHCKMLYDIAVLLILWCGLLVINCSLFYRMKLSAIDVSRDDPVSLQSFNNSPFHPPSFSILFLSSFLISIINHFF